MQSSDDENAGHKTILQAKGRATYNAQRTGLAVPCQCPMRISMLNAQAKAVLYNYQPDARSKGKEQNNRRIAILIIKQYAKQ